MMFGVVQSQGALTGLLVALVVAGLLANAGLPQVALALLSVVLGALVLPIGAAVIHLARLLVRAVG